MKRELKDAQAFLLAAGQGRRAGGPKAWRDCEGKPLLERQLDFLCGLLPADRIGVSIQAGWSARCLGLNGAVHWVAVDPETPALSSVMALADLLPLDRWTFLYHVDMRVWEPELWSTMAAAQAAGAEAIVPKQAGRRGHPILLSPWLKMPLGALDPARDRLDLWLRERRVLEIDVPYACTHDNWNT